jgi:hypothetical protein
MNSFEHTKRPRFMLESRRPDERTSRDHIKVLEPNRCRATTAFITLGLPSVLCDWRESVSKLNELDQWDWLVYIKLLILPLL